MKTFTLRITMPDGTEHRRFNCTLYKGKVAFAMRAKGRNCNEYIEYYYPFINKDLLAENGLTQAAAKEILEKNPATAVLDERIYNSMIVLGKNKGEKVCINESDNTAAEEERKMNAKETVIPFVWGVFGLRINGLLWDTENLIVDGKTHFTWDEAQQAAAGVGKRLPTVEEYESLLALGWRWDKEKKGILVAEKLFFPASGYRHRSNGTLTNSGTIGYGWTSVPNSSYAWYLYFDAGDAYMYNYNRTYGFPVRCVQDIKKK